MLKTLSEQERFAVANYDESIRKGTLETIPVWADEFVQLAMMRFPENGELVDVGCGIARMLVVARTLGIRRYFGVDPSSESITYCQKTYPELQFAVGDIRTLGAEYPGRFDGFFLVCVLMHLPRKDLLPALTSLRHSIKKGGVGFFATPMGNGCIQNIHSETLTLFDHTEVKSAFVEAGFIMTGLYTPDGEMLLGRVIAE